LLLGPTRLHLQRQAHVEGIAPALPCMRVSLESEAAATLICTTPHAISSGPRPHGAGDRAPPEHSAQRGSHRRAGQGRGARPNRRAGQAGRAAARKARAGRVVAAADAAAARRVWRAAAASPGPLLNSCQQAKVLTSLGCQACCAHRCAPALNVTPRARARTCGHTHTHTHTCTHTKTNTRLCTHTDDPRSRSRAPTRS
jgi:hypothetical protein